MSNLMARVLTVIVLLPAVAWWVLSAEDPLFGQILGLVCLLATVELLRMLGMPGTIWFALSAAVALMLLAGGFAAMPVLLGQFFVWLCLAVVMAGEGGLQPAVQRLALAQWMFIWLYLFAWSVMATHGQPDGALFVAGACLGVWAADIAAFFIGRAWGKRKLMPLVSPGKTVEGALAALLFGMPAAALFWYASMSMSLALALGLGMLLVASGIIGDLAESAFKRAVGVKDSGNCLPGHGGLLDRMDALMLAVPAAGLAWVAWP
ncbi:MAG: phosphatidate cytidylyltransferase [Mariprofundaceae bacterium]